MTKSTVTPRATVPLPATGKALVSVCIARPGLEPGNADIKRFDIGRLDYLKPVLLESPRALAAASIRNVLPPFLFETP